MKNKTLRQKIFDSNLYPIIPQAVVIYIFVFIIYALVKGSDDVGPNFGLVSVWILWWPLIPLTFVLLGRAWCAFCPWGALTDWLQSHFSLGLKVPQWIKKHGIWIIFAGFMFLTWYELAFGVTSSRVVTVLVLLVVLGLALFTGMLFEKRVWCRYLCPLGGIFGNYAQTAVVEFRGTPEKCEQCKDMYCIKGSARAQGCALMEFPKKMDSNRLCNLCGDCVKSCENDSPKLLLRLPGKELWEKRKARFDEALLAALLVGIILISGFGMLEFWVKWQDSLVLSSGLSKILVTTLAFSVFGGVSFGLTYVASYFSSRAQGTIALQNFTIFAYALIPLNLATHMAHNLFHFLGEGKNIAKAAVAFFTSAEGALPGAGHVDSSLVSMGTIQSLQFLFIFLGLGASIYVAWRIAKKVEGASSGNISAIALLIPHLFIIVLFSSVSFVMFVLPMATRH